MSMTPGYFHWKQKETRAKRPLIPRCSDPQILILLLSSSLKFLQLPRMTNTLFIGKATPRTTVPSNNYCVLKFLTNRKFLLFISGFEEETR